MAHRTRHRQSWRRRRQRTQRSGLVTVEFALTASMLFMIFFASIDFARANLIRHVVNNAAFEAARSSIIPGATETRIRNRAEAILATGYVNGAEISVIPANFDDETEELTVRIEVPMSANQWVLSHFFAGKVFVRESTIARENF